MQISSSERIHNPAYNKPRDYGDRLRSGWALGNSIELYISHGDEGPSSAPPPIHHETVPSPGGGHEGGASCEDVGGTDSDDAEAVQRQSLINLNIPDVLRAAMPSFEQYACQENLSRMMTEEEMEEVEVNIVDQEPGAYIEAPVAEFENASTWADTAVARLWLPFVVASQPTDDLSVYQGQIFGSKQEVVHAVKTFSIRSHHQYYVHKSSPTLLKLKCKGDSECPWSLRATRRKGDELWEIKKYKGPHTCVNPLMNRDHRQIDVAYISSLVSPVNRADLSISVSAIQAAVQQITGTYSCSYRKAWLAKQRVIADLFGDWLTSYSMLPPYMDAVCRENPGTVVEWRLPTGPPPTPTNFSVFSGRLGPLSRAFRAVAPLSASTARICMASIEGPCWWQLG